MTEIYFLITDLLKSGHKNLLFSLFLQWLMFSLRMDGLEFFYKQMFFRNVVIFLNLSESFKASF